MDNKDSSRPLLATSPSTPDLDLFVEGQANTPLPAITKLWQCKNVTLVQYPIKQETQRSIGNNSDDLRRTFQDASGPKEENSKSGSPGYSEAPKTETTNIDNSRNGIPRSPDDHAKLPASSSLKMSRPKSRKNNVTKMKTSRETKTLILQKKEPKLIRPNFRPIRPPPLNQTWSPSPGYCLEAEKTPLQPITKLKQRKKITPVQLPIKQTQRRVETNLNNIRGISQNAGNKKENLKTDGPGCNEAPKDKRKNIKSPRNGIQNTGTNPDTLLKSLSSTVSSNSSNKKSKSRKKKKVAKTITSRDAESTELPASTSSRKSRKKKEPKIKTSPDTESTELQKEREPKLVRPNRLPPLIQTSPGYWSEVGKTPLQPITKLRQRRNMTLVQHPIQQKTQSRVENRVISQNTCDEKLNWKTDSPGYNEAQKDDRKNIKNPRTGIQNTQTNPDTLLKSWTSIVSSNSSKEDSKSRKKEKAAKIKTSPDTESTELLKEYFGPIWTPQLNQPWLTTSSLPSYGSEDESQDSIKSPERSKKVNSMLCPSDFDHYDEYENDNFFTLNRPRGKQRMKEKKPWKIMLTADNHMELPASISFKRSKSRKRKKVAKTKTSLDTASTELPASRRSKKSRSRKEKVSKIKTSKDTESPELKKVRKPKLNRPNFRPKSPPPLIRVCTWLSTSPSPVYWSEDQYENYFALFRPSGERRMKEDKLWKVTRTGAQIQTFYDVRLTYHANWITLKGNGPNALYDLIVDAKKTETVKQSLTECMTSWTQNVPVTSSAQCSPAPGSPPVLIIGNSNVRQMASVLRENTINATSIFYPGQTIDFICSRIQRTVREDNPSHIVLMAGDIEAANGINPDLLNYKFEILVEETRRVYPWSHLILVGLTPTGNGRRRNITYHLNALMKHIASNERRVSFADNNNSGLEDNIHLTYPSKVALAERIATIIQKPHLEVIWKFRRYRSKVLPIPCTKNIAIEEL